MKLLFRTVCLSLFLFSCAALCAQTPGEVYAGNTWIKYIPAAPDKGFSSGYFLAVPAGMDKNQKQFILLRSAHPEPLVPARQAALAQILSDPLYTALQSPLVVPVFPFVPSAPGLRPGALNGAAMRVGEGALKRPDLQTLAMIKDARKRLEKEGVRTEKKVWVSGFGPSGNFCARFTFLHPKAVQAAACGVTGASAVPLPLGSLDGRPLPYPLGSADLKNLTGKKFDLKHWKKTPQFYFLASDSLKHARKGLSASDEARARGAVRPFGDQMSPRWANTQRLLRQSGAAVQTYMYRGRDPKPVLSDMRAFLRANSGEEYTPTLPKEY